MFAQKLVRSVLAKMGYSIVKHEVIGDLYKTLKAYVRADSPIVLDVGAHYGESVTEYRALFLMRESTLLSPTHNLLIFCLKTQPD